MLETVIVPAAVLFFLVTWMIAEEATRERITNRIVPQPAPIVPEPVIVQTRRGWFF